MSRFRKAIESERQAYASSRYHGDLGELATAEPSRRRGRRRGAVAIGVALAASLLLMLDATEETVPPIRTAKPSLKTSKNRPNPRLLQAAARAVQVEEPTRLLWKSPLKPSRFLNTKPRVATESLAVTTGAAPTKWPPKTRRRDFSTPSLSLRNLKNGIRFGT